MIKAPRMAVTDLGQMARSARVPITLFLNYRNSAELDTLIRNAADPRSPGYGRYLTSAQFDAAFAPSAADYSRVVATLAAAGFSIGAAPNRSTVVATASAAIVERFFGTQLRAVSQPHVNGARYANRRPAIVPAALRDVTYGVAGLNNLISAKTQNVRGTQRADLALGAPLQGPDTGLAPFAFASAYSLPVQFAKPGGGTYDGSGHAAGIAIDSDLGSPSDLANFLAYFGIKHAAPLLRRILVDGGPSPTVNGDSVETNLDAETIAGLAPGATTILYLMPDLSTQHILDTYAQVVADNKVDALNSSFGGCEIGDDLAQMSDHIAQQGAAEGITFAASSGDSGASQCYGVTNNTIGVSAPASAPHFTAVGGTTLFVTPAGAYHKELSWIGSGGGVSVLFGVPPYQVGVPHIIAGGRNVPDIAFDANPGSGATFYYQGAFEGPIGGTSLSSPIFVAYLTERNEVNRARSGAIDPTLYSEFASSGYGTLFRDITIGNNAIIGIGYFAGPGYDAVTGIGSLIGTPGAH